MHAPSQFGDELSARQADFQQWVRDVRDPANAAREGVRRIVVRNAIAEYEIAPLPEGRWAVRYGMEYQCGDLRGYHTPWSEFASREACLAAFLNSARWYFGEQLTGVALGVTTQVAARAAMLEQLCTDGLFGFEEPNVECGESP